MLKYLTFSVLVIITLGVVGRELMKLRSGFIPNVLGIYAEEQRVTQLATAHRNFRRILDATIAALAKGDTSLHTAVEHVYEAASEYSPVYLRVIQDSDPGTTLRICIARNLIGHLRAQALLEVSLHQRVEQLETELQASLATQ